MNAIPFYKSPVFLLICGAFLTRLIVVIPAVSKWTGLTSANVNEYVGLLIIAIGGVLDWFALRQRRNSSLNPLTQTQAQADRVNSGEDLAPGVNNRTPPPSRPVAKAPPATGFVLACLMLPLFAAVVVGCKTAPGAPVPFNQALGAAYALDTAVLKTIDDLLVVHKITVKDERNVREQANKFKEALEIAESTYATNQAQGRSKLDTTRISLQGLLAYLTTLQTVNPP